MFFLNINNVIVGTPPGGREGKHDHGEAIDLPDGKTLSSKQLNEVAAVMQERRAVVAALLEDEMLRCERCIVNTNRMQAMGVVPSEVFKEARELLVRDGIDWGHQTILAQ